MRADWSIYISFIGAGVVMLLPRNSKNLIRWIALLTGVAALTVALAGYFAYDSWIKAGNAGLWQVVNIPWIPLLGSNYHLAVDVSIIRWWC